MHGTPFPIHIYRYGDHAELTFHITLPADQSLKQAHSIATRIENAIREELEIEATIHMEPQSVNGEQ